MWSAINTEFALVAEQLIDLQPDKHRINKSCNTIVIYMTVLK